MWDLIVSVPDHCLSFYFLFHYGWLTQIVLYVHITYNIIMEMDSKRKNKIDKKRHHCLRKKNVCLIVFCV